MNDILVVGGGLAGLATATWCARAGARVTVLERAGDLGGRARTEVREGHALNLGGHALYTRGAAARWLRELGIPFSGAAPPAHGMLAIAGGAIHRLPAGLFSMLATGLFGFAARIDTARALATVARTDPASLGDTTWREWTSRLTSRREVQGTLDALVRLTTYASSPTRASAAAALAQVRLGLEGGVLYLDGGWQTLVDGLTQAAVDAGVSIRRDAQVTAVMRDGGWLAVTSANTEKVVARAVVLATGPRTAATILGDDATTGGLVTARASCIDIGLRVLPEPKRLFALGIDQPTYFSVHSARARLAVTGATVHVMKYLDPDSPADAGGARRELETTLDLLQPGWRDEVVVERFSPGLVATNAIVLAGHRRPSVATGMDGVFLAGDYVGDEGMLADAALASARVAADRALDVLAKAARRTRSVSGATMVAT